MAIEEEKKKYWYGVKIAIKAYDEFISDNEEILKERLKQKGLEELTAARIDKYEITEISRLGEVDPIDGGCKGRKLLWVDLVL